jgi:antitoxin ParD1/3/4
MSVKASVSLTDQQNQFARTLVVKGHYSSLSAVVQRGIELVRAEAEREEMERAALRAFFEDRAQGTFISKAEGQRRTVDMIDRKRRALGL